MYYPGKACQWPQIKAVAGLNASLLRQKLIFLSYIHSLNCLADKFAPHKIVQTLLFLKISGFSRIAATPTAADGSTINPVSL